jgi:pimeloyl-ACP methyl ester carboxylesterase
VGGIDTGRCPVHILAGEYDYSCTPELARATAERIPGARFTEMAVLGNFPMAEDPQAFLGYLRPVLAGLAA